MSIGERIRAARKAAGLTQSELANRTNIRKSTVSGYEVGRRFPNVVTLKRLAEVLGVPLLVLTDEPPPLAHCRTCHNYHAYVNAKQGRGLCDHFMHEMPEDGYCSEHGKGGDGNEID